MFHYFIQSNEFLKGIMISDSLRTVARGRSSTDSTLALVADGEVRRGYRLKSLVKLIAARNLE